MMNLIRCLFASTLALASAAWAQYPAARADETRDTLHGVEVHDPYRYLEDAGGAESRAFFRAQAEYARAKLDAIPGREAMLKRVRSLSEFQTSITSIALGGGRVFYLKLAPKLAAPVLCVREGFSGAERVLIDPTRFNDAGGKAAIDWFVPSPDGYYVAYGISYAGSEASVLRVLDVAKARDLPGEIDRTRFNAQLGWHPDGRSFFYTRLAENPEAAKRFSTMRVYRHVLGREAAKDEIVFAPGVGGAREVPDAAFTFIQVPFESKHAYAVVREGARRELVVHITDLNDLQSGHPRWKKIVGLEHGVTAIEPWRNELLLLTHRDAPNYKVIRVPAAAPEIAKAKVAVPEGDAVIQSIAMASDGLYLRSIVGGIDRLERLPVGLFGLKKAEYVKTPFDTHISQLLANVRRPGAILKLQAWIEPPAVLLIDAKTGDMVDTKLQPAPVAGFDDMDEVRLYAPGHDGTKIPVTLVYAKTTTLTGQNPTILSAYGSYGQPLTPQFDPARLAWLERGGILAVAHVRGGGEYGDSWHKGGQGAAKRNTIQDLISVAEFITRYGFTSAGRLALEGTGAGGIPVAGALVRKPELFAAAVLRSPMTDMVRLESSAYGPPNIPEFGSIGSVTGFAALREISAYHQVKDGTPYPAVLFSIGMNDARVDPWHAGKLAARLQAAGTGDKPKLLRVDFDAGHGPGNDRRGREEELADIYSFLLWQFGVEAYQPRDPLPSATPLPAAPAIVPAAGAAPSPSAPPELQSAPGVPPSRPPPKE
ncbi:hypothetical protein BWI17_12095 [Betaproteobacteria bacterium GR16-43]|nr:hypothetical protein BWI17_12095 [Betaproteobacteria bacterium GR16-43]